MSTLLVAAIDFGTTYSGWAFSLKLDFERDPTKITAKNWHGDHLISSKAPSCVLVKPDGKTFDSFGYTAENKYAELVADEKHEKWFFFRRFKMMLFNKIRISRDVSLEDACGKQLPAKRVFSMVIKFLKEDLLEECKRQLANAITDNDIRWVLTVPAIWNDAAKQFMREAAVKSGIDNEKLLIALEPEAASIFCRHLPVEKSEDTQTSLASMKAGTKYMVLDAGGGTVDITVHQVIIDNKLREVHRASGGDWGGTRVDQAYENFLSSIVGSDVMKSFEHEHMEDYIDIFRVFEVKKRDIPMNDSTKVTIRIPPTLNDLLKSKTGKTIAEMLQQKFGEDIKYIGGKMRVDSKMLQNLFDETVKSIVQHTKELLKDESCHGCSAVLMVGGFSECCILQAAVRKAFPKMKVIIPDSPGLVVLKGAVIFGHLPTSIEERICRYTYGLHVSHPTSKTKCKHPPTQTKVSKNGKERCQNIFSIHVRSGQAVKLGEEQEAEIRKPVYDDQKLISFAACASESKDPIFATEKGCFRLGKLLIPIEDTSLGTKRKYRISFIFGGTEIVVKVVDTTTGKVSLLSLDCLE